MTTCGKGEAVRELLAHAVGQGQQVLAAERERLVNRHGGSSRFLSLVVRSALLTLDRRTVTPEDRGSIHHISVVVDVPRLEHLSAAVWP